MRAVAFQNSEATLDNGMTDKVKWYISLTRLMFLAREREYADMEDDICDEMDIVWRELNEEEIDLINNYKS